MVLMLDLSLELEKPASYNHIFSDVTKGTYYYDSVHKLVHYNIVQREKNYFPDVPATHWGYINISKL